MFDYIAICLTERLFEVSYMLTVYLFNFAVTFGNSHY